MTRFDKLAAAMESAQLARKLLRGSREAGENVAVWGPLQRRARVADEVALRAAWSYVKAVRGGGGGGLPVEGEQAA